MSVYKIEINVDIQQCKQCKKTGKGFYKKADNDYYICPECINKNIGFIKPTSQKEQYSRLIDFMLDDNTFKASKDFLQSVKKYIADNDKITEGQMKAVNNIYVKFSEKIK